MYHCFLVRVKYSVHLKFLDLLVIKPDSTTSKLMNSFNSLLIVSSSLTCPNILLRKEYANKDTSPNKKLSRATGLGAPILQMMITCQTNGLLRVLGFKIQ